ncbi:MAG: stage III sporulation protein AC [Clostridia bacterium]|nr:stage III sporulation protein AC [Clostridia bacterium]
MEITLIFKIAGIGILVAVAVQILKQTGRDEFGMVACLAGLVVVLMLTVDVIAELLNHLKQLFNLY